MTGMLKLAVSKSEYTLADVNKELRKRGIEIDVKSKKVFYGLPDKKVQIFFARPRDIPSLILAGLVDIGLVTDDVIDEAGVALGKILLNGRKFRHYLCGANDSNITRIKDLEGKMVFTSYPRTMKRLLSEQGVKCSVEESRGSNEGYPHLKRGVFFEDVVDSGQSLKENDCQAFFLLFESQLCLAFQKESESRAQDFFKNVTSQDGIFDGVHFEKYLKELYAVFDERMRNPSESHTSQLLSHKSRRKIVQKIIEEMMEAALEMHAKEDTRSIVSESADLLFHFLLLLYHEGISLNAVLCELERRADER